MSSIFKRIFSVVLSSTLLMSITSLPVLGAQNRAISEVDRATSSNAYEAKTESDNLDIEDIYLADTNLIVFEMKHKLDNTYNLPNPVTVKLTLKEGKQGKSNINVVPSEKLKGKLQIKMGANTNLTASTPVTFEVSFIDKDVDGKKDSFIADDPEKYVSVLSGDEKLGDISVFYFINGKYDEHYPVGKSGTLNKISLFSGTTITISGNSYKNIANINMKETKAPTMTLSFTPYCLESEDALARVLLDENGDFEFLDGSYEYVVNNGMNTVTFQFRMKQSYYDEIRKKVLANPEQYLGYYLLTDMLLNFADDCLEGGRVSSLPIIYNLYSSSYDSGGSSGGSSGGGSSGSSGGGTPSNNSMANNEYNTAANSDIGWRVDESGNWLYLDSDNISKKGWLLDQNGNWFYLNKDGKMAKGWNLINGSWYFLQESGQMVKGWNLLDGKWYYLKDSGSMSTGWIKHVDGNWYYLQADGSMAVNITTPDNYKVNEAGVFVSE